MNSLDDIRVERVSDVVYRGLREAILSREFVPGARLDVDELAARLRVSRTPVKDAIAILSAQGLVEVVPRRGTFVRRLTARDISETFDVRSALEVMAAERLAVLRTDRDLTELREALTAITDDDAPSQDEHWARNARFHATLVDLVGSRRLSEIYGGLQAHLQIARLHRRADAWLARRDQEAAEHLAIVEAIEAGDPASAGEHVKAHIARGGRSLLTDLESEVGSDPSPGT